MDTKQLSMFVAAYECDSMSKAAEQLFITPQGLSRAIAALETELGSRLFVRSNHGVTPTAFARAIYPKVREICRLAASIQADAGQDAPSIPISLAVTSGGLAYFGPDLTEGASQALPHVSINTVEADDVRVCEQVGDGSADCGVVAGPVDSALFDAVLIVRHPHALVVSSTSDLASREEINLCDLEGRRVGIMARGFAPFEYIQRWLAQEGVHPRQVIGFAEMYTGVVRARKEDICLITTDFLIPPGTDPGLAVLPFKNRELTWDEYFITRRGEKLGRSVAALRDFLLAWTGTHEAQAFPWRTDGSVWPLSASRAHLHEVPA